MGIKRNEVEEPQWTKWDYAVISKEDLFSGKRWRETPDWNIILKQVEKTRQASQMIDIRLYPSKLFFAALDLLEANLYMIDDMFFFLTGMRMIGTKPRSEEVKNVLGFWSMDSYKVLEQIKKGLIQAKDPLIECLKQEPLWDISLKVIKIRPVLEHVIGTSPIPVHLIDEERASLTERLAVQLLTVAIDIERFSDGIGRERTPTDDHFLTTPYGHHATVQALKVHLHPVITGLGLRGYGEKTTHKNQT